MDYYKYEIKVEEEFLELLLAFLSQLPFDTFEETGTGINAYIPAKVTNNALEARLQDLTKQISFNWSKHFIPYQNWNEIWESNFEPIQVGQFCGIRADFHPTFHGVQYEIIINPRMAFGTGHHATTFMMLQMMETAQFQDKKVLDYGCGTGILAIMAAFLGASSIDAIDIEEAAYENTLINVEINKASNIQVFHGTLPQIEGTNYDTILANINRNVILNSLPALYKKLVSGGSLLVSGFVQEDETLLRAEAKKNGFAPDQQLKRADWICLRLIKQ